MVRQFSVRLGFSGIEKVMTRLLWGYLRMEVKLDWHLLKIIRVRMEQCLTNLEEVTLFADCQDLMMIRTD